MYCFFCFLFVFQVIYGETPNSTTIKCGATVAYNNRYNMIVFVLFQNIAWMGASQEDLLNNDNLFSSYPVDIDSIIQGSIKLNPEFDEPLPTCFNDLQLFCSADATFLNPPTPPIMDIKYFQNNAKVLKSLCIFIQKQYQSQYWQLTQLMKTSIDSVVCKQ